MVGKKDKGVSFVVGADGMIGRALTDFLVRAGKSVLESTRRRDTVSERRVFLDLSGDVADWRAPCPISVAYLSAAVTSLDDCRRNPTQSATVNVHNTVTLAKTLIASDTFVIFLSSNLVYDGSIPFRKTDDPVCPLTEYGRQKAKAESQLLALGDLITVVRLTKVLGPETRLFTGWVQALQKGEPIHPFSDIVLSPLSLGFVVQVLGRVGEERISGIVQVSGERDITYEQAGRHIAERIGVPQGLVRPIRSRESGLILKTVPSHTTLDTCRLRLELGLQPPDVWSVVDSMVRSLASCRVLS